MVNFKIYLNYIGGKATNQFIKRLNEKKLKFVKSLGVIIITDIPNTIDDVQRLENWLSYQTEAIRSYYAEETN